MHAQLQLCLLIIFIDEPLIFSLASIRTGANIVSGKDNRLYAGGNRAYNGGPSDDIQTGYNIVDGWYNDVGTGGNAIYGSREYGGSSAIDSGRNLVSGVKNVLNSGDNGIYNGNGYIYGEPDYYPRRKIISTGRNGVRSFYNLVGTGKNSIYDYGTGYGDSEIHTSQNIVNGKKNQAFTGGNSIVYGKIEFSNFIAAINNKIAFFPLRTPLW